jgi:hypothetical protein
MGAVAKVRHEEVTLFPARTFPGLPAAGVGRPAEGPLKPFFNLPCAHRYGIKDLPDFVTDAWLWDQGYARYNEHRFIHSLQFTNLIDASRQPVWPLWELNRSDPRDPTAFYRELLQNGYGELERLLCDYPFWEAAEEWLRERFDGSEQMVALRLRFYKHLRLAAHVGASSYDALMRKVREVGFDAALPPPRPGMLVLWPGMPRNVPKRLLRVPIPLDEPADQLLLPLSTSYTPSNF